MRIDREHILKMPIPWCVLQEFDLEDIKQALRNLNVLLVDQLTLK